MCISLTPGVHLKRRHSVHGTLKKHVDAMTMERSTSDHPLQKRQTVKAYRDPWIITIEQHGRSNKTKTKSLTRLSCQDRVHPLLPAHGIEQEYWICPSSNDRVISSVQQVLILGARHEIHSIHLASHRPILISDLSSFASFASSEFQRRKLSR